MMDNNRWIESINERNNAIDTLKSLDKYEYLKLKYGLYHGKGKRKKKHNK